MAEPIPQADAALLAAQAQGGQAGVAAYQAAKAQLEGQKQAAVQQALREASLRGTPLEAAQSLSSTVASGYDQQLAQLTQGQASFQGDMAARAQRATDYNAAVGSARTLIPVQVQQQIAPILARNQFELGQIDRQSAGRVSEIEAQRRLFEARAEAEFAAFQARQREAAAAESRRRAEEAAEMPDLNQSELRSALVEGARGNLGSLLNEATNVTRQRAAQAAARGPSRQQAQLTEQREREEQQRLRLRQNQTVGAAAGIFGIDPAQIINPPQTSSGGGWARSAISSLFGGAAPAKQYAGDSAGDRALAGMLDRQPQAQPRPQPQSGRSAVSMAMQREADRLRQRQRQERDRQQQRLVQASAPPFPAGFLSPEELGSLGPYGDLLASAGESLNPTSLTRLIGGLPNDAGQVSPISSDLFRQAMLDTAGGLLDQGYDLHDAQILEALGSDEVFDPGSTLFDVESRMTGGRDLRTQFELDQKDNERLAREDEAAFREQEDMLERQDREDAEMTDDVVRQEFFRQWGIPLTESLGPRDDVIAVTSSPEFDASVQAFEQAADGQLPSSRSDVDAILDDAGINDPLTRRLIREIYLG